MSTSRITVAVLGEGRLAELVAQRIAKRPDLELVAALAPAGTPPEGTACVVYLPAFVDIPSGLAADRVCVLLQDGFNVVSTLPAEAVAGSELLEACREGAVSFHGTGGFQSSLVSRFNRAFASITRDIREIELIEELDIGETPAHPWAAPADTGLEASDAEAVTEIVSGTEVFYDAAARILSEAVFHDAQTDLPVLFAADRVHQDSLPRPGSEPGADAPAQVQVRRSLGGRVAIDSVWTHREGSEVPLRYRLNTTSADAIGHLTISFHAGDAGSVQTVDHLAAKGLLDAIRPVVESKPGILRHELEINHVMPDPRLAHVRR